LRRDDHQQATRVRLMPGIDRSPARAKMRSAIKVRSSRIAKPDDRLFTAGSKLVTLAFCVKGPARLGIRISESVNRLFVLVQL